MDFSFGKHFVRSEFAQNTLLYFGEEEEMHISKYRNSIEAGSFTIESVDYRSLILPVTLVNIHPLSCKYKIKGIRVKMNCMEDLNTLPRLTPE